MATPENPFPDQTKQKKSSYVSSLYSGQSQPQTPLYFSETITASIAKATGDDQMSFDSHEEEKSSVQSSSFGVSVSSSTTFRDTQIDQLQSDHLMHVQNLSSIVNNPKRKGLLAKAKDLYLKQTGKKIAYRALTEKDVEDSAHIPRVNPQKDFRQYLRQLKDSNIDEYLANHPPEEQEPFAQAPDASSNLDESGLDAVAKTLRRSSSSQRSTTSDMSSLP
jgi:hypothetical protein